MDDGRYVELPYQAISRDRLDYGYAITVHRAQGLTVDTAYRLDDGGGRELAYVALSRARHRSTVYLEADTLDQAAHDLTDSWSAEHRQAWALDSGTPVPASRQRDLGEDLAIGL